MLQEHWEGCAGTVECYRNTGKAVLAQWSTIGALGRLCWHSGVLWEHWEGCAGTVDYYRSTGEAVLAQWKTIGALESRVGTGEY